MAKKRGGAESTATAKPPLDEPSDLDDEEFDGADLDIITSDEAEDLPSGSDVDEAEEEEEEVDSELRNALIDYQTTASRLREDEAAGTIHQGRDDDDDDEPG